MRRIVFADDLFEMGNELDGTKDVQLSIDISGSLTSNLRMIRAFLYDCFDYKQSITRLQSVFTTRLDNGDVL